MAPSAFGRLVSCRPATSLFIVSAFMAFLVTQAPHLVHHFFDPELVQDECPFAANGDRTGGLQIEPVGAVTVTDVSIPVLPAAVFEPGGVAHATPLGRAPPARLS